MDFFVHSTYDNITNLIPRVISLPQESTLVTAGQVSLATLALTGSPNSPSNKCCNLGELRESHLVRTSPRAAACSSTFWCAWVGARCTKACKMSNTSKWSKALLGWLSNLLRLTKVPSVVSKVFSCSGARTFLSNSTKRTSAWQTREKIYGNKGKRNENKSKTGRIEAD